MKKKVVCLVWVAFIFVGIFSLFKTNGELNCVGIKGNIKDFRIGYSSEIKPFIGIDNDRE